jgi:enoyl-CoA hydratase/carnithine racemase
MNPEDSIVTEWAGETAVLMLNRPDVRNALRRSDKLLLANRIAELEQGARAIVIRARVTARSVSERTSR